MDLFFALGFSFLYFLKNLGFVGYVLLYSQSKFGMREYNVKYSNTEAKALVFIFAGQIIPHPTDSQCESIDQVFAYFANPNMMRKPLRNILEAKRRTSVAQMLAKEFENPVCV